MFDILWPIKSFPVRKAGLVVEKLEQQGVAVDWTRPSFMEAITLYRDLFTLRDGVLTRTEEFGGYKDADFVNMEFNCVLKKDDLRELKRAILGGP